MRFIVEGKAQGKVKGDRKMKDKDYTVKIDKQGGYINADVETPKYAVSCLICDKTISVYDYPVQNKAVCEDCKKAIAYAKELLKEKEEYDKHGGSIAVMD